LFPINQKRTKHGGGGGGMQVFQETSLLVFFFFLCENTDRRFREKGLVRFFF